MKILTIGNFGHGWDGSICDEEHIAAALEKIGHEVTRAQREHFGQEVIDSAGPYDFILIAQWSEFSPEQMELLQQCHPLVYWAFDFQASGQPWHENLVAAADMYLSQPLSDAKYPNWRFLAQDFAPDFLAPYRPIIDSPAPIKKDIEVLFTGSFVPWESAEPRVRLLKEVDDRFDLHIYGITGAEWTQRGFKNVHGPAMDDALPELIARSKIVLSIDNHFTPGFWSDRNAQALVCGGVVLFRHVPLSEAIFKDHVFYFYEPEDCLVKIERLLELKQDDYDQIGYRNFQFAQRYLSVDSRVAELEVLVRSIL